jgi:hypothetical protein
LPQEWFAFDLTPWSGTVNLTDPDYDSAPEILANARRDFAPILFRDGMNERGS